MEAQYRRYYFYGQLHKLKELDLGFNRLTNLPPEVFQLHDLQVFDLRDNELTSLSPEIEQSPGLRITR
jgi:Leucine-rich repeat (LRR) protein